MPETPRFTFAVIADSHFHPAGPLTQSAFRSDARHNDRNRAVVQMLERAAPDFVIHLGDVPHPVPGIAAHAEALAIARRTYGGLSMPLHVVPGNHDVGDKPHPWAPAPSVGLDRHRVFSQHWGAPWRSFDHGGCRFVLIDAPVMNSGLPLEGEQWGWLERTLASRGGRRVFAFIHYPPYLHSPDEDEHYDNLAEPARGRLLRLLTGAGCEALFAGHVHHFFYNRFGPTDLYIAPATSFVRPGYAELAPLAPSDGEYGRDAAGRLGFFLVHVHQGGYQLEPVRTEGATEAPAPIDALAPGRAPQPPLPLGVTLRHAWDHAAVVPADNLDPFRRKLARNDLAIQASWTLGVRTLRLPVQDLLSAPTRARLEALAARGQRAVAFAVGLPDASTWEVLGRCAHLLEAAELILPRPLDLDALAALGPGPPVWISAVGQRGTGASEGAYFSHFPAPGFTPDDPELAALPPVGGVVFKLTGEVDPYEGTAAAVAAAPGDATPVVQVWLPRRAEGLEFEDDAAVARRMAVSFAAAKAFPSARLVLDTFSDHDRGYYPRHGLIDRRGDPRPGFHVLRHLARLFPGACEVTPSEGGYRLVGGRRAGELRRRGSDRPAIDLVTGAAVSGTDSPALVLDG